MSDQNESPPAGEETDGSRPSRPEDGPPSIHKSPEGASEDRQIAQEPQQSSGLGLGQS
jgi:hypothetical protein